MCQPRHSAATGPERIRGVASGDPIALRDGMRLVAPRQHSRAIVVIDTDPAWSRLRVAGHLVHVVQPDEAFAEPLEAVEPPRTLLNLAAPGALSALERLRIGGFRRRVWGVLSSPGAAHASGMGMVETLPRPMAVDAVLGTLLGWMPHDARLVLAGADRPALLQARTALAHQRLGVSLAWDPAQAVAAAQAQRADLVVVDLGMPGAQGHLLVGQLATLDPSPALLLLTAPGDEVHFQQVQRQMSVLRGMRARADVLASALCGTESPLHARPRATSSAAAPVGVAAPGWRAASGWQAR